MSTLNSVLVFSRAQSQTDSNGLTDTNGVIFANEALVDFNRRLVKAGVDASAIQEAYRDGVIPTTAGNGSTFLYPDDLIFLKAIEVNFVDTNPGNYITATQVDQSNIPGLTSFSWLRQNASTLSPQFADNGDWGEIFPSFSGATNITQAIRIFYFQKPTEYTSVSDTISYPLNLDYRILGWRVARNYYYSLNKFTEGDAFNVEYERRAQDLIATLGRGAQQPLQATVLQLTGWDL